MAYLECVLYVIIPYGILIFNFCFTPYVIIKHIIKKRLLRQKRAIQTLIPNRLLTAEHIFDIEFPFSLSLFFVSIPFIVGIFFHIPEDSVKEIIHQMPFHIREDIVDWPIIPLAYYMIAFILFILLHLILLYIRKALGKIQGSVLFDPKEKRIYVFPYLDSGNYKEYHESELTYTTESFWNGGRKVYVFFTKKENDFAFKVDNLYHNDFNAILSQRDPIDMPIPFKYRFHTIINLLIAMAISLFGMIVVLPLMK